MFYVVPGVLLLWAALRSMVRPHGRAAFWVGGAAGSAAMVGVQAVGAPALGEWQAAVAAYGVLALAVWTARRWAAEAAARRPARGRHQALPRHTGAGATKPGRRAPVDLPVAQARAIELANRRAIRWKEEA